MGELSTNRESVINKKDVNSQWHKLQYSEKEFWDRVLPTGVEPMTFRTSVERSTTELQETRGSLGHITRFKYDKHPAYY